MQRVLLLQIFCCCALLSLATAASAGPSTSLPYGDPNRLPEQPKAVRNDIVNTIAQYKWDPEDLPQAGYDYIGNGGSDVAINNISLLSDAMYEAAENFPTKYNRIRIQNGDWSTAIGIGAGNRRGPSFAEGGGLIIEPDAGHNPIIDAQIQLSGDRIVFRNLTFTWTAETNGANVYIFEIRSTSGFQLPEGVSPGRFIFEDNRFGGIFKGQTPAEAQKWPWILRCNLAWSFIARRNTLRGTNRGWYIAKALVSEFYGNDYGESTNNPFSTSQVSADGENGYDKLPTNDSFMYVHQELHRGSMDLDPALGTHMDFFQVMPYGPPEQYGTIHYWIEDCLVTGSHTRYTYNELNQTTFPTTNMLIYTVTGTESIRGGLFNNICATNGFFVQAGHPQTSTDVWFNTAGVQPITPPVITSSDGAAATQYFYGTGVYRSGYNVMRPPLGQLPSSVEDQVMSGFPGVLESQRPEFFFTGVFPRRAADSNSADPNGVSYWPLPQSDIYKIDPVVLRAALVNQFTPHTNVTAGASFTLPAVPETPETPESPAGGSDTPLRSGSPAALMSTAQQSHQCASIVLLVLMLILAYM